jgi:hypothetical protein
MNHPWQKAGFLQTALPQVEGEPRSKALFRREGITATSAGPELPIAVAGNGRSLRYRTPPAYPTIQRLKTIQSP